MAAPIAIQLYTVREALAQNFKAVVTRIAEMGYVGVETAGFHGVTVEEASDLFADLGLEVCSLHTGLPLGKQKNQVIELAHELEVARVVTSTPREAYASNLSGVTVWRITGRVDFDRAVDLLKTRGLL